MEKYSKTYELYKQLEETLNSEQRKILVRLDDEYMVSEVKNSEKSFKDGEKQGLKTAIKLIADAI